MSSKTSLHLPSEVLENIFYLIVESEKLDPRPLNPRSFSRVSSIWRTTALLSPGLWRHIPPVVIPEHNTFSADYNRSQHIDLYLQRSKGLPLTFSLIARHFELNFSYTASLTSVANRLKAHSHRWENITLDMHPNALSAFADIQGKIPALHTLRVVSTRRIVDQNWSVDYFSEAPALRNVTLICGDIDYGQSPPPRHWSFTLPWHQLATYKEEAVYNMGFVQVIAGSTNLTSAHLTTGYFSPTSSQVSVMHEKLTQLNLDIGRASVFGNLATLFDHGLVLPALRDLRVSLKLGAFSLDGISSLIIRSQCPLRRLSLTRCVVRPGTLISLLQHCPKLEELCVDRLPRPDLERLVFKPGSMEVVLVPKLRNLVIYYSANFPGYNNLECRFLSEFARSRVDIQRESTVPGLQKTSTHPVPPNISILLSAPPAMCQDALEQLEGFPPVPSRSNVETMVQAWKDIMDRHIRQPSRTAVLDRGFLGLGHKSNSLRSILKEMESYDPVSGINLTLIYRYDILGTLDRLVATFPERETASGLPMPGGIMESTSKKARKLLAKWRPLLENHAVEHRRWAFKQDMTALIFLGEDDERRCVDKAWEFVTGTVKSSDMPWWWERD